MVPGAEGRALKSAFQAVTIITGIGGHFIGMRPGVGIFVFGDDAAGQNDAEAGDRGKQKTRSLHQAARHFVFLKTYILAQAAQVPDFGCQRLLKVGNAIR